MVMQIVIIVASVVVAWLVFTWLIRVVKTTISTALTIAAIVLVLQLVFGIGPQQLWQEIQQLPQAIGEMFGQ
jgi:predicted PurR-regulated permease PerM